MFLVTYRRPATDSYFDILVPDLEQAKKAAQWPPDGWLAWAISPLTSESAEERKQGIADLFFPPTYHKPNKQYNPNLGPEFPPQP